MLTDSQIETLPTRSEHEQELKNILSLSTAGRNRYLLHFNSHHSLLQWTAAIRLAMYEHATLQEAYTGALIAGKGKSLNSINLIMERSRFKTEEWVRVRFGAGVPWRRCWCVISPPDEKEVHKMQKELKKKSPYDRSHAPVLKGDIKFYDSKKEGKKQKKARPIASITDAYSAYAIYPQAKSLIDASTLIKIEGNITIHAEVPVQSEGFVFVMPEVHPAVSGFEMMLRFLFPTWDAFALYGRPGRLIASTLDQRSLMFAMPRQRRYGYLDNMDVTGLLLTEGSGNWSEREWRRRLKELTGRRMNSADEDSGTHSRTNSRRSVRLSFGGGHSPAPTKPRVGFADESPERSGRSVQIQEPGARTDSARPSMDRERAMPNAHGAGEHTRDASDPKDLMPPNEHPDGGRYRGPSPSRGYAPTPEHMSSDEEHPGRSTPVRELQEMRNMQTPEPVQAPPTFARPAEARPANRPYHSAELRRANSRLSSNTLHQMAKAGNVAISQDVYAEEARRSGDDGRPAPPMGPPAHRGALPMHPYANQAGADANASGSREALTSPGYSQGGSGLSSPAVPLAQKRSKSPLGRPYGHPNLDPRSASQENMNHNYGGGARSPGPLPGGGSESQFPYRGPPAERGKSPARDQLPSQHSNQGIHRKPLPQQFESQAQNSRDETSHSEADAGSYDGYAALDDGDMDLVQAYLRDDSPTREPQQPPMVRQGTERGGLSSRYDDASSTASPDYASTKTKRSMDNDEAAERPRAGVLRTVGGSDPSEARPDTRQNEYDIPEVNFGPRINYAQRQSPGGMPTQQPMGRGPAIPNHGPGQKPRPYPPAAYGPMQGGGMRDENMHSRNIAWRPGMATPGGHSSHGMSPEQFVRQQAAVANQPLRPGSAGGHYSAAGGAPPPHGGSGGRPMTPNGPYIGGPADGRPGSRGVGYQQYQGVPPHQTYGAGGPPHMGGRGGPGSPEGKNMRPPMSGAPRPQSPYGQPYPPGQQPGGRGGPGPGPAGQMGRGPMMPSHGQQQQQGRQGYPVYQGGGAY